MPMPIFLPHIEPTIPEGYLFVAVTLRDPAAPISIMGWPTKRRDSPDGPLYDYPVTPEHMEARIRQERLDVVAWRVIAYEDIPKDRTYRGALKDDGMRLHHDMPMAREIHKAHLRVSRIQALMDLDVEYQRADEQNDKDEKARVVKLKQELRDLTAHPGIEAAQTVEELKQVWHEALK
jgi:hypothetical protein